MSKWFYVYFYQADGFLSEVQKNGLRGRSPQFTEVLDMPWVTKNKAVFPI